ncbi:toxin-antitoxin system HicB family antitoxin [Candidatus Aalborgicola defluviihabitans]|uniref:toxin-antitoxin system HicB family antitoxin n=1 Tax=Candidatus Aalborgicola defluviihabitans TaxID=3386187 RepID=UPI001DF25592|nr:toxin-antitoxin system HicB family antitoxin [Burkholderiales bacterium]
MKSSAAGQVRCCAAFAVAVGDYIETYAKFGQLPQKPVSGKILLRVPPAVNSAALMPPRPAVRA